MKPNSIANKIITKTIAENNTRRPRKWDIELGEASLLSMHTSALNKLKTM
jgi:hypothetical protein